MQEQNVPLPPRATQQINYYEVSKKNRKIGLFFIFGPIVGLALILLLYAVINFALPPRTQQVDCVGEMDCISQADASLDIVRNVINVIFGFIGVVLLMGAIIGLPLGIILIRKKELASSAPYDERSGKGENSVMPVEIKKWNWGAFGLPVIWGIYFGVWISLLSFIPIVGFVMRIVLGLYGNEWAWKKNRWENTEKFLIDQKKWEVWGIIFFILSVLVIFSRFSD